MERMLEKTDMVIRKNRKLAEMECAGRTVREWMMFRGGDTG